MIVHIWLSGIVESVTSAPVVQQVVPNIGENNEVNFTVTTFSIVEVGTLFALMIILFKFCLSQLADRWSDSEISKSYSSGCDKILLADPMCYHQFNQPQSKVVWHLFLH